MPRYKLIPPVVLALPLLIGALITGLNYPLTWDEPAYYSVLMIFGDNYLPSIEELRSYNRFDATPLSAIIFGLWGKIFGFDPWKLRILSVFFSFGAILAFYMISKSLLKKYDSPVNPLHLALLLMLNPYFYATSFLILSDPSSIFFFMFSLLYYIRRHTLLFGFFAGLAILTRQFYLFLPISILLYLFIKKRNLFYRDRRFFGALLSLAMFFPFFYLWGWHLSPAFPQSYLGLPRIPSLSTLNYHLSIMAFYSLPLLTLRPLRSYLKGIFYPLLLLPLFLLKPPLFDVPAHGILYFTLDTILGTYKLIPLFLMWYLGILLLVHLLKLKYREGDEVFLISIIIFSIMMLFYSWISDKYLLAILPMAFLLFATMIKDAHSRALLSWVFVTGIFTGVYSYLLFFKLIN